MQGAASQHDDRWFRSGLLSFARLMCFWRIEQRPCTWSWFQKITRSRTYMCARDRVLYCPIFWSDSGGRQYGMELCIFPQQCLLGVGLAMDAFSVSMANGLHDPRMSRGTMCRIAGTFALFQAVMPMTGWVCVHTIVELFSSFENSSVDRAGSAGLYWRQNACGWHQGRRGRRSSRAECGCTAHAGRGYQHRCAFGGLHHFGIRLADGTCGIAHHCGGHLLYLHGGPAHRQKFGTKLSGKASILAASSSLA